MQPLYFPTFPPLTDEQWDALSISEKVDECSRYLPLLGYERGVEYQSLLVRAHIQLRVGDLLDEFDIKHMVDCLWKWRRYRHMEAVALAAEKQSKDTQGFAGELGLDTNCVEHLAHLLHASNAYGAIDSGPDVEGMTYVTPQMIILGFDGKFTPIREALGRELKKVKREHADVLRRIEERNPDLAMRAGYFSGDYLTWRLETRLSLDEWLEFTGELEDLEEEGTAQPDPLAD